MTSAFCGRYCCIFFSYKVRWILLLCDVVWLDSFPFISYICWGFALYKDSICKPKKATPTRSRVEYLRRLLELYNLWKVSFCCFLSADKGSFPPRRASAEIKWNQGFNGSDIFLCKVQRIKSRWNVPDLLVDRRDPQHRQESTQWNTNGRCKIYYNFTLIMITIIFSPIWKVLFLLSFSLTFLFIYFDPCRFVIIVWSTVRQKNRTRRSSSYFGHPRPWTVYAVMQTRIMRGDDNVIAVALYLSFYFILMAERDSLHFLTEELKWMLGIESNSYHLFQKKSVKGIAKNTNKKLFSLFFFQSNKKQQRTIFSELWKI